MSVDTTSFHARFAVIAALPVALLLAAMSIGGILTDAYARESPAWVAQAIPQDWFDLVIAAPLILACGIGARGSRTWRVLLAGAYAYTVYELFLYTVAVHFNALFLVYCATLGVSAFALISALAVLGEDVQPIDRRGSQIAGAFLVGLGSAFALLWLAEDLPAVLDHRTPASLVEIGLFTNPVHVIDLAFVLPAHIVVGVWLWRGRSAGELYAPVILAFDVVMLASLVTMLVAAPLLGGEAAVPVIAVLFVLTVASAAVLARVLRGRRRGRAISGTGAGQPSLAGRSASSSTAG